MQKGINSIENNIINNSLEKLLKFVNKDLDDNLTTENILDKYNEYINLLSDVIQTFLELENKKLSYMEKIGENLFPKIESDLNKLNHILTKKVQKELENDKYSSFNKIIEAISNLDSKILYKIMELKKNLKIYQIPYMLNFDLGKLGDSLEKIISSLIFSQQNIEELSKTKQEYIATTINENVKTYFFAIIGNPDIKKEEKINYIKSFYKDNIEKFYFFPLREKISDELGQIFAYTSIGEDLFETLIKNSNGQVNKNIRLYFIKYFPDISKIIDLFEENSIELGFRSTIMLLDRLKYELEKNYNENYLNLYKKYKKELEYIYKRKKGRKNNDKIYNDFLSKHSTFLETYQTKKDLTNNIKEGKKQISLEEKMKLGYTYKDIKEELEKTKLDSKKLLILFENYPIFIVSILINRIDLNKKDLENTILKLNDTNKILSLLELFETKKNIKFDKNKVITSLANKNLNFYNIVNILGHSFFKWYKFSLTKNAKVNKKDMTIFLKFLLKSKQYNLIFQSICPFIINEDKTNQIYDLGNYALKIIPGINAKLYEKDKKGGYKYKAVINISI